jgi:hypothetical protein
MDVSKMRCNKCGGTSLNNFCLRCGCIVGEASSGNTCFISTACAKAKGLPDDCDELQTLRHWRDGLSKDNETLRRLCSEYYVNAPRIIDKIDAEPNSMQIYNELYLDIVCATVDLLKQNKINEAIERYEEQYRRLCEKYKIE